MRRMLLLASSAWIVHCGGGAAGTTPAPAAEPEHAARSAESVEDRTGEGRSICHEYVQRALECARREAGEDLPLDVTAVMAEDYGRACSEWMKDDVRVAAIPGAMDGCEARCADGAYPWHQCIARRLGAEAPAGASASAGAATTEERTYTRIPRRPMPPGADACDLYTGWIVACVVETLPEEAAAGGAVETMQGAMEEACAGMRAAPEAAAMLERAVRACADVACGVGGSDLAMCFADALANAAASSEPDAP